MNSAKASAHTAATAAVITINNQWQITAVNRPAEELLDQKAGQLVGSPADEIFGSETKADLGSLLESAARGETIANHPLLIRGSRLRSPRIVAATIFPLPGNGEQANGALLYLQNASKSSFVTQDAMDCMREGVFTTDVNLRITSLNKAAELITGWKREEAIGTSCRQILQCRTCADCCALRQSITSGTQIHDRKVSIISGGSAIVHICLNSAPLRNGTGKVVGCIGSFYGSTQPQGSSLILDSVADGVFTVDREWKITSFNRAAEVITGWNAADAIGRSCSEVFQSSLCGRDCAIAHSLYTGHSVANRSITICNRGGDRIPISISASPLADDQGNIIGGVETFRDLSAITALRQQLAEKYHLAGIVSKNPAIQRIFSILPEIAASPSTVLIQGESGTGKKLLARALYGKSDRCDKPFVTMNCGAMPESILASELFAPVTGRGKKGCLAAAEGGTLFLEEIEAIPLTLQLKLLLFLQEGVYVPPGSDTRIKSDVRLITATRKDLGVMVVEGTFREELYYRLNVVRLAIPPLRERKEDIPLLIKQFIGEFSAGTGKDIVGISNPALNILMRHDFPGNIRELKNIIEYAFILCDGAFIMPENLPDPFARQLEPAPGYPEKHKTPRTLEEIEKDAIITALENNGWDTAASATKLGISPDALRRKMNRYNIDGAGQD